MKSQLIAAAVGSEVAKYLTLGAYILVLALIAIIKKVKKNSIDEFLLANRNMNGWLSAFAYGATYFSAVVFVGFGGKFGWSWGLAATWVGITNAVLGTLVAWLVLANRTRMISRNLDTKTMPDFLAKRFGDKKLKIAGSLVIFIFLVPYSASVYQGLGAIFELTFGLDFIWCVLILAGITAVYLFFGGYLASSIADFFQGLIMVFGTITMIMFLLKSPEVNWGEGLSALFSSEKFGLFPPAGDNLITSPLFNWIIIIMLTSFGIWALPQSIHKFYAIKDRAAIKKGLIISTVFSFVVGGGAYFTGSLVTRFVSPAEFTGFDSLVPTMINEALPGALLGLVVVLLLSASISTLAALSLTSASTVSVDFYKAFVRKNASDKETSILMRVLCIVFVAVSAILAYFRIDAIVTMMSLSWGLIAGCFMGPYVLGLYSKRVTAAAAWSSIIGSVVLTIGLIALFGFLYPEPNFSGAVAVIKGGIGKSPIIGVSSMIFSLLITIVVSLFTKPPKQELIDRAFNGIGKAKAAAAESAE